MHEITNLTSHFGPVITLTGHVAPAVGLAMLLQPEWVSLCLLYTSDAADELLCVALGGCRIIKKKKIKTQTQLGKDQ